MPLVVNTRASTLSAILAKVDYLPSSHTLCYKGVLLSISLITHY